MQSQFSVSRGCLVGPGLEPSNRLTRNRDSATSAGKPDNEYSESFLDELEKLAEQLEAATRNQDCTSDDFRHSNPKTQAHDIQPNISLDSGSNFLTRNIFQGAQVTSSPATTFITQCDGSSLEISRSYSQVSAQQSIFEASEESPENSLFVPNETSQGDICWTDDNNSNPTETLSSQKESGWCNLRTVQQIKHKNTSFGTDASTCRKKENRPSQFILGIKRSYLDPISVSPTCIERDGNKAEAQETKNFKKIRDLSAKVTQIYNSSSTEISSNSVALDSNADSEVVSVAGPSGLHAQSHRTGMEKGFVCEVCGKAFSNKQILKVHLRTHSSEKPFLCPMCDKGFTEQGNLTKHLRTHTGEKPFTCNICSKGFARKHHLDCHLRTHTGVKPFGCLICSKGFALKHHLKVHLQTHTGEKPFACHICRKGFAQKHHLEYHLRTHTGEKP
ncbi:Histone-lysine N-methyltransferase PRDM9 [Araneus ventricosus]|uniref:Histone-lysine N-methyltransferase PRDM9 n=1 Tax=Araneus ventricosus TaxID=182803 RepID=A0A4Y2NWP7_ARAVE|nr:Histone-lysine N-methyltransferase PRDM9 [Araneus ventricosus]